MLLARRGELRPIGRHALLRVQVTALNQHRQNRGRNSLAARRDHHQRVRRHRLLAHDVGAAPQVNDLDALVEDDDRRRVLARIREISSECVGDQPESLPDAWNHVTCHAGWTPDQARSKRSRFMTLSHAATKSRTNFSFASSQA